MRDDRRRQVSNVAENLSDRLIMLECRGNRFKASYDLGCNQITESAGNGCADNECDDCVLRSCNRQKHRKQSSPPGFRCDRDRGANGTVVFRDTHSGFRRDGFTAAPNLVLRRKLIDAGLELSIDAFAAAQLARQFKRNDIASPGRRRKRQAGGIPIAPDQTRRPRQPFPLDGEIELVGKQARILKFDFRAEPVEVADGTGDRRVARVERNHSAVIDAVSVQLPPFSHGFSRDVFHPSVTLPEGVWP